VEKIRLFRKKEERRSIEEKSSQEDSMSKETEFLQTIHKWAEYPEIHTIEDILQGIREDFTKLLRTNVFESGLNQAEIEKRLNQKKQLRKALRECAYGDINSKIFVKGYIKELLLLRYRVSEENITELIPFQNLNLLTARDQFDIMLYRYQKSYGMEAMAELIRDFGLDQGKRNEKGQLYYEITCDDIYEAYYQSGYERLSFLEQLDILTQRIYSSYKGNGVIDEIRDMHIDGISAGVSGIPESFDTRDLEEGMPCSYDSVWIFFHGKSIHMSFLSFLSYRELTRVCKNIYRYNNPGQLSEVRGYTVNEMKDGSRIAVARPPFAESWVLFVRKFDSVLQQDIHRLVTDENNELPIEFMKWLIRGERVIAITGEQGSGKTTLLMSLIAYINPAYNLRIQEMSFELHLRKIYPKRNIVTFRETNSISGQEGLDFQKKTDGSVNILGEVATAGVSSWMIQMAQIASLFTLFTHHAKTTDNLIAGMRNALLQEGGFQNERIAAEQVADCINYDIHMKKKTNGHRYIERITEIVPDKDTIYQTRNLIVWEDGRYLCRDEISERGKEALESVYTAEEREEFRKFLILSGKR
jgi:pilus assembly protein CpaF